jgi:hypothetical protein
MGAKTVIVDLNFVNHVKFSCLEGAIQNEGKKQFPVQGSSKNHELQRICPVPRREIRPVIAVPGKRWPVREIWPDAVKVELVVPEAPVEFFEGDQLVYNSSSGFVGR